MSWNHVIAEIIAPSKRRNININIQLCWRDFGRHDNILVDVPCKMELNFATLFFIASGISFGPLVKKGPFFHHTFYVLITRMPFCSCFVSLFKVLQKKLSKQCNILHFVSKFFQLSLLNLRFKLWIGKFIFQKINWILL